MKKIICLVLFVVLTQGCSKKEEERKEVATPWDDQIETMNQFEKVGEFAIETRDRRDQEMEQQMQ